MDIFCLQDWQSDVLDAIQRYGERITESLRPDCLGHPRCVITIGQPDGERREYHHDLSLNALMSVDYNGETPICADMFSFNLGMIDLQDYANGALGLPFIHPRGRHSVVGQGLRAMVVNVDKAAS